jgi:FlaG/FlaF family flagellin (archaellin)
MKNDHADIEPWMGVVLMVLLTIILAFIMASFILGGSHQGNSCDGGRYVCSNPVGYDKNVRDNNLQRIHVSTQPTLDSSAYGGGLR